MDVLLDVVHVEVAPDYRLRLVFKNGERRIFDMAPYLDRRPYLQLKDKRQFARASVDCGTVVWPGDVDISPETLYLRSAPA